MRVVRPRPRLGHTDKGALSVECS